MSESALKYAPAISILCTSTSIVLSCVGTFSERWWLDLRNGTRKEYGLLNPIECEEDLCNFSPSGERDGWITFVYVSGIVQWCVLLASLIFQGVGFASKRRPVMLLATVILSLGALLSFINTFVTIGQFTKLSLAFKREGHWDRNLMYQTLPVGFIAIASSFTIPAVVFLATGEKRGISSGEKPSRNRRNLVV